MNQITIPFLEWTANNSPRKQPKSQPKKVSTPFSAHRVKDWKKLSLDRLSELGVEMGRKKDDASVRRIAIVVGETFGEVFDRKVEINLLTAAVSAFESELYKLVTETKLHCDPLEREEPPSSWKKGQTRWRTSQLKLPHFRNMLGTCGKKLARELLEEIIKGGGKENATGGPHHGKAIVRRVSLQGTTPRKSKKSRTRLHQPGRGGKTV